MWKRDDIMVSCLMFWGASGEWSREELFDPKVKTKLETIRKQIVEIMVLYGKKYGEKALNNLQSLCDKQELTVQPKTDYDILEGTYTGEYARTLLSDVANTYGGECDICTCKDHTKCVMFAVKNLINGAEYLKGECPYKLGEAWE